MTVVEGARQSTARVIAERALTTSMDSVMAGFYGPLMEEYHILGLDDTEITPKMQDYMSYTFKPQEGLHGTGKPSNLYGISLDSVNYIDNTSLTDQRGDVFIHEVTQYMKYSSLGHVAEFFLEKASLLEQPKKISILYEEKASLEKKLVTIDEGMLILMKYIDGLSTGRKGLLRGRDGSLKAESNFTKKVLQGLPTMENTGINNELVFQILEKEYIDPSENFDAISADLEKLKQIIGKTKALESSLDGVQKAMEEVKTSLQELEKALSNSEDGDEAYIEAINTSIKGAQTRLSALEDEANRIGLAIDDYKSEQMNCINALIKYANEISELVSGSLTATEEAIIELDYIIDVAGESEQLIKSYEKKLYDEKEDLDAEVYNNLLEGLEELKKYQIDNSKGYNFLGMKDQLNNNYQVLSLCQNSLAGGYHAIISQDYTNAQSKYKESWEILLTFDTSELKIDYSTLVIEDKESPDYLDSIKGLIAEGITDLVIDSEMISHNEITEEELPSIIFDMTEDKESFSFSKLLKNMKIGGKDSDIGSLFGSFGDFSLEALIGNTADELVEGVLLQAYVDEHFYKYSLNDEKEDERKPTVLSYEWEYLLYGNRSDRNNLKSVIGRLILTRTILNFTGILGDRTKWCEAKSIATSLVGFTGLPVLVAITQGILMILLALYGGLVDTCALLLGKRIPIIKKQSDLNYRDLLLVTREKIKNKANAYGDGDGFSYKDYMTIFLYLTNKEKLSYRMMDLIQENINIRYGINISLQNIIFAYEAEARFNIKPLFTNISFIQEHISSKINKPFIVRAEYSY